MFSWYWYFYLSSKINSSIWWLNEKKDTHICVSVAFRRVLLIQNGFLNISCCETDAPTAEISIASSYIDDIPPQNDVQFIQIPLVTCLAKFSNTSNTGHRLSGEFTNQRRKFDWIFFGKWTTLIVIQVSSFIDQPLWWRLCCRCLLSFHTNSNVEMVFPIQWTFFRVDQRDYYAKA